MNDQLIQQNKFNAHHSLNKGSCELTCVHDIYIRQPLFAIPTTIPEQGWTSSYSQVMRHGIVRRNL